MLPPWETHGLASCNGGRVATAMSMRQYTNTFQRFIAAEKPPHLKAIAPWEGAGDFYRQTLCRGGIPNPAFWGRLSTTMQAMFWPL